MYQTIQKLFIMNFSPILHVRILFYCLNYFKPNFGKYFCAFYLFLSFQLSYAQDNLLTIKEINKKFEALDNPNSDEDIKTIEKLVESSKKNNYQDGVIKGNLKMLYVFHYRSDLKEMLKLIRETEELKIKDKEQLSLINIYKSYTNKSLGIQKEELQNIKDALKYSKQIKDPNKRHISNAGVYNRFSVYYDYKTPDSLIHYLKKELEELEKINDTTKKLKSKKLSSIALNNINIGNFYLGVLKPQRLDLAEPYYLKVYNYKNTNPDIFEKEGMPILCGIGRFYLEKGDYKKSIEIANEVLEKEKTKKNPAFRHFAYMLIADSNEKLKYPEEQAKYMKLYVTLNDSLSRATNNEINKQFEKLITDAEKKKDEEHNATFNIFLISIICFALIVAIFLLFYLKRKKARYEELVSKIESENSSQTEILFFDKGLHINKNVSKEKSSQITDATIYTILSKLEKFERSDKYLKNEISLNYLASQLGTNTKYLSEVIKLYKGKSYSGYINGLRINYIATLLYQEPKFREYKISYLAELAGFSSREVFAVVFKKETGVTPSYFIDNLKNDISA